MMTDALRPDAVPSLWRLARVELDAVRNRPVLLYPEGVVFLNESGAAIIALCDGRRTLAEICDELSSRYQQDVRADVEEYVGGLVERELMDVR